MPAAEPSLFIRPETQGPVLIAHLSGRFGQGSYGGAFMTLRALLKEDTRGVVLDLAELDYISSAGLAAIVRLNADLAERGVALRVAAAPAFAMRIFEAAGMVHAVPMDAGVPESVAAIP